MNKNENFPLSLYYSKVIPNQRLLFPYCSQRLCIFKFKICLVIYFKLQWSKTADIHGYRVRQPTWWWSSILDAIVIYCFFCLYSFATYYKYEFCLMHSISTGIDELSFSVGLSTSAKTYTTENQYEWLLHIHHTIKYYI